MAPTPQNGFFVSWEQVMAFFAMAEEALKAKSSANEVEPESELQAAPVSQDQVVAVR